MKDLTKIIDLVKRAEVYCRDGNKYMKILSHDDLQFIVDTEYGNRCYRFDDVSLDLDSFLISIRE